VILTDGIFEGDVSRESADPQHFGPSEHHTSASGEVRPIPPPTPTVDNEGVPTPPVDGSSEKTLKRL